MTPEKCNPAGPKTSFQLLQDVFSSYLEDALFKACFETFLLKEGSIEVQIWLKNDLYVVFKTSIYI